MEITIENCVYILHMNKDELQQFVYFLSQHCKIEKSNYSEEFIKNTILGYLSF